MKTDSQQLLAGILYDETGDRLTPSHAGGKTRRYRYYVSQRLLHGCKNDQTGWRLPAPQLEKVVTDGICGFLSNETQLADALGAKDREAGEISAAIKGAQTKSDALKLGGKAARDVIRKVAIRIEVSAEQLIISISRNQLASMLGITEAKEASEYQLEISVAFRRRGIETRMLIGEQTVGQVDQGLVNSIASAHAWLNRLTTEELTISQLANEKKVDDGEISRILPLAFLAPDIVRLIIEGRHPAELTARRLKRLKPLPLLWHDQRRALGFQTPN